MIKKWTWTSVSVVLGAALVSSSLAFADTSNFNPVGKYPIAKQPITISAFMVQNPDQKDLGTNGFTTQVEKLTNINFQFVAAPKADFQAKEQLELSSGSYPEVFLSGNFTKAQQLQYGQQGILIDLKPLIDKYAPHIKAAMNDVPLLQAGMTAPNGKIYSIPAYNACFHCWYSQKYWINQTMLNKLHLNTPTTTAQFEHVLEVIKQKIPNGIPLDGEGPGNVDSWHTDLVPFLMNAFIYDDGSDYLLVNHSKVDISANKSQWKVGLSYIHDLWSKGLIAGNAFTQNFQALQQTTEHTPEMVGVFPAGHVDMLGTRVNGKGTALDYTALAPLKGPQGVQWAAYFRAIGNGQFAITNKATQDQQIAAIRLADYLFTMDGSEGVEFGPKGSMWWPAKPGMKGLDGQPALYYANPIWWSSTESQSWDQSTPNYRPRWVFDGRWSSVEKPSNEAYYELYLYQESLKKYAPHTPPYSMVYPADAWVDPTNAQKLSQLQTSITTYINTWTAQFITGKKDLNKDWQTYVNGFNGLNLNQYLGIYQKAYDDWSKKYSSNFLAPESATPPKDAAFFTVPQK